MGLRGSGYLLQMTTLAGLYQRRIEESADRVAFRVPSGSGWRDVTWAQLDQRVREVALALISLGVGRGDRCALILNTHGDFYPCALGVLCAGAAVTTIYTTSSAEQCAQVLADCDPAVVFVEDAEQSEKLEASMVLLRSLRALVQLRGEVRTSAILSFEAFAALGRVVPNGADVFTRQLASITGEDVATVIYTSGTTGEPKGVELTHAAWDYVSGAVEQLGAINRDDVQYFWLPMAHSFGFLMLAIQLRVGFSSAVDGRLDLLMTNLGTVQPTFLCAVPRLLEKAHSRIRGALEAGPAWRRQLASWALASGGRYAEQRRRGRVQRRVAVQRALADALVLRKIRARFGGRVRFLLSGGAALNPTIAEFFDAVGLPVLEGWGLTEACGVCSVNRPGDYRFGTVGRPLPGTEIRLDASSRILVRSPGVMRGYFRQPDRTREVIDEAGWLHTGDVGAWDGEFLTIVDRERDLIKTSNGRFIAPQHLEAKLKSACQLLAQVVVHGEGRQYCCALVTLDADAVRSWGTSLGLAFEIDARLSTDPDVVQAVSTAIDRLNETLASFERIRRFSILERDLSLEAGELTASQKLRRKAVERRYARLLNSLYEGSEANLAQGLGASETSSGRGA